MDVSPQQEAIEHLQHLGLKEYEAKCFVALTQVESGTARSISESIDVPRTRVYEATRVLEQRGLIEVQHASPQRYRAIDYEEAIDVLRAQFDERFAALDHTLSELASERTPTENATAQEIWALTERTAIERRTTSLLEAATAEVVFVVGDERVLTETLLDDFESLRDRGVHVTLGTATDALRTRLIEAVPDAEVFESTLPWLQGTGDDPAVGRLVLVDGTNLLASTITDNGEGPEEHAVFGTGFGNSLVVIVRRLLTQGGQ